MINKRDIILICALLCAALTAFAVVYFGRQSGDTVAVYVNNIEYARIPLNEDGNITIHTADGGTNELVVKNGKAYIKDASCPDKICVDTGKVSKKGSVIACLPNGVIVVIE